MQSWSSRPVEESYLFNPAFCGLLIASSSSEFTKKTGGPLPFPLAFMILPIILHQKTRKALPATTVTSLMAWSQDNREIMINFPDRVRRLSGITRESILFSAGQNTLWLDENGNIKKGNKLLAPTTKRAPLLTRETEECIERSAFLGRWLASAGTTATIYAAWGITP